MKLASWIRPAALIPVLIVWLAVGGVGGSYNGKLSEVQENDASSFLPAQAESTLAGIERSKFTSADTLPAIYVFDGGIDATAMAEVDSFVAEALSSPVSEEDARLIGDLVEGEPFIASSHDGEAIVAVFEIPFDLVFERAGESRLGFVLGETLREIWAEQESETPAYLTGPIGIFVDQVAAFSGIDSTLLIFALSAVFIILVLVYRSPWLPLLVLSTAVFALGLAALVVYYLADSGAIALNGQSQGIMSILVVGATTDYGLLLVARYREELRRHDSTYEAMRVAWRRSLEPILASSVTVILGLLTLLLSNLTSNQSLGPVAALGIVSAVLAATTLLPGLLLIAGKRSRGIFWPKKPTFHPEDVDHVDSLVEVERNAGVWGRVSASVAAHPRRTWVAAFVGLMAFAAFLPTFNADGIGDDDAFTGEVESLAGFDILEAHFDAGQTDPITIDASEATFEDVIAAAVGVDGVSAGYALTPAVIQGAPGGVVPEPPVVIDGRVAIDVVSNVSASTQEAKDIVLLVRAAVQQVDPTALVGGSAATGLDINLTTDRDITIIIPTVLVVILLVLIFLLRAVVAPLIIVAANLLSFAATIGVSAVFFNHVFHFPGSDSGVPLFSFVFLVALGVDYSIFLMSRVREESLTRGTREGVRRGLAVTGGVITSAGVVLAATFSALAFVPILFLLQLAFIVAVGVLIDTLVVRTLLVPGAIYDLDRAAWWPLQKKIKA